MCLAEGRVVPPAPTPGTRACLHFDGKEGGVWERLTLRDGGGINLCLVSEEVR